jgi:hypothetical protein
MATVPTADSIGLGSRIPTEPDRTPVDGPSAQLAFAAQKINAGQLKNVGEATIGLSKNLTEAMIRSRNKDDTINRAKEFNSYFQEMSDEFQNLSNGDLSSTTALEAFNFKLKEVTERYLGEHGGSSASIGKFAVRLEDQRSKFSANAASAIDAAQKVVVDNLFNEDIAVITAQVARGELTLSEALVKVDGVAEEHADATSTIDIFNKTEVAQELVIIGSLQRFIDLGHIEKAEALINNHPEVIQTLDPKVVGKMIRDIEVQKIEKARLIQKKQADRDNILQGAGVSDPSKLTPSMRMLYYTGKLGPKPGADDRTKEMKNAEALTFALTKYGKESPQYKNLVALVFKDKAEANTPLRVMLDRLTILNASPEGQDSAEFRILTDKIKALDPEYVMDQQKKEDFPAAQESMTLLQEQTAMLMGKIDEALKFATNQKTLKDAIRDAEKGDVGFWETGNVGAAMAFIWGSSEAAQLEAALTPIRSNTVLTVMAQMRAKSSSGATGLGAMNNEERVMLRDSAGSLDTRLGAMQLLKTLLNMRKTLPIILKRQEKAFNEGFAKILGADVKTPDPKAAEDPDKPRGDGKPPVSETGSPVIQLNKFEVK